MQFKASYCQNEWKHAHTEVSSTASFKGMIFLINKAQQNTYKKQ